MARQAEFAHLYPHPPASPLLLALRKAQFDRSFNVVYLCLIPLPVKEHYPRSKNYDKLRKRAKICTATCTTVPLQ